MATISLSKDRINNFEGVLNNIIKSSNNLDSKLGTLKQSLQGINGKACNLQGTLNSISSSSKTEEDKVKDIAKLKEKITAYITVVVKAESNVSGEINKQKKEFYDKYHYLKPFIEKNPFEILNDALTKVDEWCKDHWKAVFVIIAVVIACVVFVAGIGVIISEICAGIILGAIFGALIGGYLSQANGGSFWKGAEDGAFEGAIAGALCGFVGRGLLTVMKPATTAVGNVFKNGFAYAMGGGTASMTTATMGYYEQNGTLKGGLRPILESAAIGAAFGGVLGAIGGKLSYRKPTNTTNTINTTNTTTITEELPSVAKINKDYMKSEMEVFKDSSAEPPKIKPGMENIERDSVIPESLRDDSGFLNDLNEYIRTGRNRNWSEEMDAYVNNLSKEINKSYAPEDITIYRSDELGHGFDLTQVGDMSPGTRFYDPEFSIATMNPSDLPYLSGKGNYVMKIQVPKDTAVMNLNPGENKLVLIDSYQNYEIVNTYIKEGVIYVEAKMVPGEYDALPVLGVEGNCRANPPVGTSNVATTSNVASTSNATSTFNSNTQNYSGLNRKGKLPE